MFFTMSKLILNIKEYKIFLNFNSKCNKKKLNINILYTFFLFKTNIFCNILNTKIANLLKFKGYQYISPYWNALLIKGNLIKIKKNMFNTTIFVSNHIETFYLNRTLYLNSPLIYNIINQKSKKIIKYIKYLKKENKFFI